MENYYSQNSLRNDNPIANFLRLLFVAILGLYAATHVIFLPIEFTGILYCADPLLIKYLAILIGIILLKYYIFIDLFFTAYSQKSINVLTPILNLLEMGLLCFGALMINKVAINMGLDLMNSPYIIDLL